MCDVAEFVEAALDERDYSEAFDCLFVVLTDAELYQHDKDVVFHVISHMQRDDFDNESISKRLDSLFTLCKGYGVVTEQFMNDVYDILNVGVARRVG